jgi:alkylation response protein AidB-like acyl-CoA dehydrogenase
MYEWSEDQLMVRDTVRRFVEAEVVPNIEALEHGDLPPYDVIRKLYATFGMDQMARDRFKKQVERKEAGLGAESGEERAGRAGDGGAAAMTLIPIIELCHYCPGIVTAMGVSVGLAAGTIMKQGTPAQMERWGLDLLTMDKIGAWAITEPDSGSDALGGMKSSARRDGDEYILNGNKTFITNGPYADTVVFYAKLDDGSDTPVRDRQVLTFVLDKGMPGFEQSKPFRKMGLHSSPTGELFLSDVRVGKEHLLGETEDETGGSGRDSAMATSSPSGPDWPPCPSASSRSASSCRWSTPRTGSCGESPSGTASSSSSSWPRWRWPGSTCRTWSSATSSCPRPARASPWLRPRP